MRITAHIPVEPIVHDPIVAATVHTDAYPRIELENIVVHRAFTTAVHQQRILIPGNMAGFDGCSGTIFKVNARSISHPFIVFIMVVTEPVGFIFPFTFGIKFWPIVVGKIAVFEHQATYPFGQQGYFIPPGSCIFQDNIFTFYLNSDTGKSVGQGIFRCPPQHGLLKIDGDVFAGNYDYRLHGCQIGTVVKYLCSRCR